MVTRLCPFSFRLPALSLMSSTDTKVLPEPESQDKLVGVRSDMLKCQAVRSGCCVNLTDNATADTESELGCPILQCWMQQHCRLGSTRH